MSIIYNNTEEKSELQRRITAELREKQLRAEAGEGNHGKHRHEYAPGTEYQKDLKTTTSLAWAWALILIAAVALVIYAIVITN